MIKKLQILLLATIAIVPLAAKKDKDAVLDSINQRAAYIAKQVTLLNEKQKCSTVIMQKDVGTTGYVIYDSGDYCLGEDITFNPANPATFVPVTFTGGDGSGAAGFAAVSAGVVRGVIITESGTGYTSSPTAVFGGTGTGAAAYGGFSIASATIDTAGSGYIVPEVIISGDGQGAVAVVTTDPITGAITGISFAIADGGNPGGGYTEATLTIIDAAEVGSGATATANLAYGPITGVNVTAGGSGYQNTVQAAITILASNVNLQLNNHTLSQAGAVDASTIPNYAADLTNPSTQVPFVVGILIPDTLPTDTNVNDIGLESIYISGDQAIINGFSMWGAYVFGHTADIRLSSLTIKNCGVLASHYLRPFVGYIPNNNSTVSNPGTISFSVGGLNLGEGYYYGRGSQFFTQSSGTTTPQNRISQMNIDGVTCLNNFCFGAGATYVTDCYIANSHFDGTFSDDPNVGPNGLYLDIGTVNTNGPNHINMIVEDSTANGTSLNGDSQTLAPEFPVGSQVGGSQNVIFRNCTFNHTASTFASGGAFEAAGFICGTMFNSTWENCSFSDVSGIGGSIVGLHMSGQDSNDVTAPDDNIRFINCTATNIQTNGSSSTGPIGFQLVYAKNVYMENCVAADIIANGPAAFSTGFYIDAGNESGTIYAAETDNHVYRGCIAQRVLAMQGGVAMGFALGDFTEGRPGPWAMRTIAFEDCIAEGCQSMVPTLVGQTQGVGIGFWSNLAGAVFGPAYYGYPVTFTNCTALNNTGAIMFTIPDDVLINTGNQFSAGFFASSSEVGIPLQNHSYYNCTAINNIYGFLFQNAQNCTVRNCRSENNLDPVSGTIGEGFTDLGLSTINTPTAVLQSHSLFEFNHAYNNGLGTAYSGENQNYNIFLDAGLTLTPPLLEGQVSTGTYTYVNPATYTPVHNISMIK